MKSSLVAGNVQPYQFVLPPNWKQLRIANILSGNYCQPKCAEPWIEVKFENEKQGKVQVVASPLIRLTNSSDDKGSPLHLADTVTEQDKTAEEHAIISSGEQKEFLVNPDTKVFEENNDKIDEGEANNMNLADDGSKPVDHDQGTTTEVEKGLEVPGSETVSNLEDNKPSEPLIEPPANLEKEPVMPATENDKLSDILAPGVSGDSDKGLSLLHATQTS